MRDLQQYARECLKELDAIGIEYGSITEFVVNTRARKRWGLCKPVPGGFQISISSVLLDERNDETGLKNTIIHEILHTCKGCLNHKENWKRVAHKVNVAYGYNIKRTSSASEKGVLEETRPPVPANYVVECECCGHTYTRTKKSKLITNTKRYRCGVCGGQLFLRK